MDAIHTIRPEGSLVGTQAMPFIRDLEDVVALDARLVVVDVRGVEFLTKDAVRTLRRTAAALEARDDALVLLAPNEMVRGLLKLHDPAGEIPIFDSQEQLEAALEMHLPEPAESGHLESPAEVAPNVPEPAVQDSEPRDPLEQALSAPGLAPRDAEEAAFTPSPPPRSQVLERLLAAAAERRSRSSPGGEVAPEAAVEVPVPEPEAAAAPEPEPEPELDSEGEFEVQVEFEEDAAPGAAAHEVLSVSRGEEPEEEELLRSAIEQLEPEREPDSEWDPPPTVDPGDAVPEDPATGRLSHAELDALTGDWPPPEHEHAVAAAPELDEGQLAQAEAESAQAEVEADQSEEALAARIEHDLMATAFAEAAAENQGTRVPEPEPEPELELELEREGEGEGEGEPLVWPPPEEDPIPHRARTSASEPAPAAASTPGPDPADEIAPEPEEPTPSEGVGEEGEFDDVGITGALDQLVGEGVFGATSPDSGMRLVEPEGPSDPPASPDDSSDEVLEDDELGPLSLEVQELLECLIDEASTQTERWKAVRQLGRSGDASAVPFLQELAEDPEPTIREMAAVSLRRLGALPSSH